MFLVSSPSFFSFWLHVAFLLGSSLRYRGTGLGLFPDPHPGTLRSLLPVMTVPAHLRPVIPVAQETEPHRSTQGEGTKLALA